LSDFLHAQQRIGFFLSRQLPFTCVGYALGNHGRSLTGFGTQQLAGLECSDLELHIDPVRQWSGNFSLISRNAIGRAATSACRIAEVTARAGIHGSDQLKTTGKFRLSCRT
jgi:hypothetical protein